MTSERFLQSIEDAIQKGERDRARSMISRLELAQHCYSALLEQAKDAVIIFTPESGKIIEFNSQALQIFADSEQDFSTISLNHFFSPQESVEIQANYQRMLNENKFIGKALPFNRMDGTIIYIDVTTTRIQLEHETLIQGIFRDVTERVKLLQESEERAKELEEKNAKLEEAQQLRSAFLATISHELRTPLNAIIGYNSLLEDGIYGELNQKQQKAVRRIDRNATRLLTLINQLLQLSRLEAGASSVFKEKTNLVPLIQEIMDDYRGMVEEKEVDFLFSYPHDPMEIITDPAKIHEIIRQLISNAVKFTHSGSIQITLSERENHCIVEVKDTGPGIKPEQREEIFELFRQADASFTRRYEGAGLGLAIVRRLSDLLNICVQVESELDQGACFKLLIPSAIEETEQEKQPDTLKAVAQSDFPEQEAAPKELDERHPSVLIVDDDPYTVEVLSEFMETHGQFRVYKAYTGMHAMIHLAQSRPDILLVDLLMPHINGERVIRYCHELWGAESVGIIVITGKQLEPEEMRQLKTKVNAIIPKGELRPQTLTAALQSISSFPFPERIAVS